ncbi:MAG: hypothetical protein HY587_03965 [Candidatus Omnitrophica bacterium]|nr:hypothetical protein [Candidatus Omnitrophota bacterium]
MQRKFSFVVLIFVLAAAFRVGQLYADEGVQSSPPQSTAIAQSAAKQAPPKLPVELIVQALKVKAEKALEEKRKKEAWKINVDADVIEKYETNPSLTTTSKGDWATVEDASLTIKKHVFGPFTGEYYYSTNNTHYNEFRDNNSYSNVTKGTLITELPFDLESKSSYEFEYLHYPFARDSNVYSQRWKEQLTWRPNNVFSHRMWWQYQWQRYRFRDQRIRAAGLNVRQDFRREDTRQEAGFEETVRKWGWTAKMSHEFYRNWSNDHALGEPFDKWFYKMKYTLSRNITKKLSAEASYAYDRTIFLEKNVTGKNEDQIDNANEFSGQLTYKLSKRWKIKSKFKYKGKGSNADSLEYENYTFQSGLYFSY